jgi:3-dehydroquinate dehydratase-1
MELKTPSICAAITAPSIEEFLEALGNAGNADLIELRADGLETKSYSPLIKELLERAKSLTNLSLILTIRMKDEGGAFSGTEKERVECIKSGIELADMIDIELRMNESDRDEIIKIAKEKKVPVILSYHDFEKTPGEDEMISVLVEEEALGADIAKLAVKANFDGDVIRLLNVTQQMGKKLKIPVCTISMGKVGTIARIAAPIFGSALTYGYVTKETAPGQLSVSQLDFMLKAIGVRQ